MTKYNLFLLKDIAIMAVVNGSDFKANQFRCHMNQHFPIWGNLQYIINPSTPHTYNFHPPENGNYQ